MITDVTRLELCEADKMATVRRRERGATRPDKRDAIGVGCQEGGRGISRTFTK